MELVRKLGSVSIIFDEYTTPLPYQSAYDDDSRRAEKDEIGECGLLSINSDKLAERSC